MKIKRIYDISRKIHPEMMVWPGDPSVIIEKKMSLEAGNVCNVSSIQFGVHTGTHIDAPLHFIAQGRDIASLDISKFIGFVKVFEIHAEKNITKEMLLTLPIEAGDAVFLKTRNSTLGENESMSREWICLDASAAEYLIEKKIKTVGVDHLSLDSLGSDTFPIHHLLLPKGIGVIEGLRLQDVKEGEYFFSALPLRIQGVDGSPTRAVLLELE